MANRFGQIALMALTCILMLMTFATNFLSFSPLGRSLGVFSNDSESVWSNPDNLTQSILTPPSYAFGVWGFIYAYQIVMLVYCWSLLFRKTSRGQTLSSVPGLLPTGLLVCHSLSSVLNTTFVLLADRTENKHILLALVLVMFALAGSLTTGLVISFYQLWAARQRLRQEGLLTHYWLVIGLQQNAIGFYAGWAWIAGFINIDNAITNLAGFSTSSSSLLCLCQLYGLLFAYVTADFSFLDPFVRFFFGPYLTLLWALSTSVTSRFSAESATSNASLELTVALAAVVIVKAVVAVVRQNRSPLPEAEGCQPKGELKVD